MNIYELMFDCINERVNICMNKCTYVCIDFVQRKKYNLKSQNKSQLVSFFCCTEVNYSHNTYHVFGRNFYFSWISTI